MNVINTNRSLLSVGSWDTYQLRFAALLVAIMIYAVFGSPTPDRPGMIEVVIGALLVLAVSPSGIFQAVIFDKSSSLWRSAGQLFLAYGLSAAMISGVLHGNAPSLMIRDILPFLFLFLPLFLTVLLQHDVRYMRLYIIAVAVTGFLFALRSLSEFGANPLSAFWQNDELTYLANAPTLLFAGIFVLGAAGLAFIRRFNLQAFLLFALACLLAALPLTAMAVTLQRASIGYFVLAILILVCAGFRAAPLRMLLAAGIGVLCMFPFLGDVVLLRDLLIKKTALFGLNMRAEEWFAVWEQISQNPLTFLFGLGWGGTFESPSVAGIRVNFTHGLFSSMILKTGIIGLALCALYIGALLKALLDLGKENLILVLAILGPVLIDVFLYASFKSLDFGLILLLIPSLSALKSGDSLQE